jgi:hypothetical protein
VEVVEAAWVGPSEALEAQRSGKMALAFPTVRQLEALTGFDSAAESIDAFRDRRIEPVLPKVIGTPEEHRVVLPGDPDYPD